MQERGLLFEARGSWRRPRRRPRLGGGAGVCGGFSGPFTYAHQGDIRSTRFSHVGLESPRAPRSPRELLPRYRSGAGGQLGLRLPVRGFVPRLGRGLVRQSHRDPPPRRRTGERTDAALPGRRWAVLGTGAGEIASWRPRARARKWGCGLLRPSRLLFRVAHKPNTYSTSALRCSLSSGVLTRLLFAEGLGPDTIAIYCLPPVSKVMGGAEKPEPIFIFHISSRLVSSKAATVPSSNARKTSPPPVASVPL